jgi:hypothetical protein
MPPLRNAFARIWQIRERITLKHGHFVEVICQRASGQETAHSRTHHDRVLAHMRHGALPALT